MHKTAVSAIFSLVFAAFLVSVPDPGSTSPAIPSSVDPSTLAKKKQTSLGLYITAEEAHALLQSRKDVALIDVRTPEETMFVGYPERATANIPYKRVDPAYGFNAKKRSYKLIVNPDFATGVRAFLKTPAGKNVKTLLLMCRSGNRSAPAVNALANAGFTNAYSVVDGFEGDKDDDDRRTVNGWKNAGAPWTTRIREDYWLRSP